MRISIQRLPAFASAILVASIVAGYGNPAWSQRSATDSTRSARGSTEGRTVETERPSRSARGSMGGRQVESDRTGRSTPAGDRPSRSTGSDGRDGDDDTHNIYRGARGEASRPARDSGEARRPTRGGDETRRPTRDGDRTRQPDATRRPDVYRRPNGQPRPNTPPRTTVAPRPRPTAYVDVRWPWQHRHRRGWSPTYRYRQVVHIDAGWGYRSRRTRLDVRTYYRQRVRSATPRRADVELFVDRIEVFENGRFVGEVRSIPRDLARINATMYRSGSTRLDRDLFIVGDPDVGFELISTRHYGGFVLDHYRRSHGYRAGFLDFRNRRVRRIQYARFFDPYDFQGFVPVHLLPEDEVWLGDFGYGSPSYSWYGDDVYYFYGSDGQGGPQYDAIRPRSTTSGRATSGTVLEHRSSTRPMQRTDKQTFRTERGAEIRVEREVMLERIE